MHPRGPVRVACCTTSIHHRSANKPLLEGSGGGESLTPNLLIQSNLISKDSTTYDPSLSLSFEPADIANPHHICVPVRARSKSCGDTTRKNGAIHSFIHPAPPHREKRTERTGFPLRFSLVINFFSLHSPHLHVPSGLHCDFCVQRTKDVFNLNAKRGQIAPGMFSGVWV